jgi:16S rRNA (uracil1498-N3)-methyltransferase
VNLLLVEAAELDAAGVVVLADRRADHLRTTLRATVGTRLRAGVIGGCVGDAEVISDSGTAFTLRVHATAASPQPLPIDLVLAVPRPKVLGRAIETAAAFGVSRIALTNAWRVDKSYLASPRTEPPALALATRLGAEQGGTTHLPPVELHRRFMAMLDAIPRQPRLLVAHPGGVPLERATHGLDVPTTLAIGPEGGWIAREVETFAARGFAVVSLGTAILRVETALAAALGQLVLLERLRDRSI